MNRLRFIEHKGVQILFADYTRSYEENKHELYELLREEREIASSSPRESLLVLSDLTDCFIEKELQDELVATLKHNKPFIKKSAVLGITGIKKFLYNMVMHLSGRKNVKLFEDIEDAKDWLVEE